MQNLKAANRLVAALVEGADEVDAQFDQAREPELRSIQITLKGKGFIFSYMHHHIYHNSNDQEIEHEAKRIADILNESGYQLRIVRGIFSRASFALKGANGIVLQRVQTRLRIFFSI